MGKKELFFYQSCSFTKFYQSLKDIKYDINHFTNGQKVGLGSYHSTTFVITKPSTLVKGPPV